ncbi:glycosyltransferase [Nocardioides sp. Arc9.136]|uniref:glycosyltransferase n=1 Tax=Nocardioides sp. Arc9.136 TaxID=2996826 RepID=UPI002666AD90|nr:glycosyltransferase [Nocardioides sp. Arc9.136]WKN48585.1 glycosyltransferase [Nocardioides sp. Arc9.136]
MSDLATAAPAVAAAPVPAPEVSVVVPVRNEERTIDECLRSVLAQDFGDLEVVVVDNGSTDATPAMLRAWTEADPRVRVLTLDRPSIPAALNAALAAVRGRWLVRVDAHSTVPPEYVGVAMRLLRTGRWVGVGGRKDAVAATPTGKAIAAVLGSRLAVGGSTYHHGTTPQTVEHVPFGCYPTERLRAVGGWDEGIANNEDFELDQRLRRHGELYFDPSLCIAWNGRERIADLFAQYRRYGTGKPAVALRHPGSVSPRHLAPPALVAWLATFGLVSLRHPRLGLVAVTPYAAAVGVASTAIIRDLPAAASRPAVPAALVAMQVGWGVGFWQGTARLLRRTR